MFGWLSKRRNSDRPATQAVHDEIQVDTSESKRLQGNAFLERDQFEAAAACYQEAVRLDSQSAVARVNLGFSLLQLQRQDEAEAQLRVATALDPANADAQFMLGNLAKERGEPQAALQSYERVIEIAPKFELAYREACLVCIELGQMERVLPLLQQGLEAMPQSEALHFLMGNAHQVAGRHAAAVDSFRQALAVKPNHVETHANIALALASLGRLEESLANLQRVAAFRANDADSHLRYGAALQKLGHFEAAVQAFKRAVAADPASPVGYCSLGSVYAAQGRRADAISHYRQALSVDSRHAFAHAGLGVELNEEGRATEAAESLREAITLDPNAVEAHSGLLFLMSFLNGPDEYVDEARRYGDKVMARLPTPVALTERPQEQPVVLRVGIVSGDLRAHPVAAFLEGVLVHLDRQRIEPYAYVTSTQQDEVTQRLRGQFAGWTSIVGMDDEAAARRIKADGVHVLIDVAGHTGHNRLPVFAWKPAPVQLSWLGYLASTGLPSIDYVLADRISLPSESQRHFVEKVWYLPHSLNCFTAPAAAPLVGELPALLNPGVTFGSFQRLNKVSDAALQAWSKILDGVPKSQLRLQAKQFAHADARSRMLDRLQSFGIAQDKVELSGPIGDREAYLSAHQHVDIVLDTFPYVGITTTCEALFMGVPTVTLLGDTLLSRQGAALLHCVDLDDWVARDIDDYVACAIRHACDLPALANLRAGLRQRALASPLFNAPRFARDLQEALRGMWDCARVDRAPDLASDGGRAV